MKISQRSLEEVREAANIVEIASEFTALRRQGARYTGLCPYPDHSEKTPSFSVSPDKGFYYCFGCGKGGDAIKLVTELKNLDFVEAVSYLAEHAGVELELEGASEIDSRAARKRQQQRRAIHKALAAAAVYYHKYLSSSESPHAEEARNYLRDRGMDSSTIEEFRLGLAPLRGNSGFIGASRKLGLDRKILEAAGLISPRGGERFAGRITFPISERRGRIVGFGARAMGDAQPKYLNSPETDIFNKRDLLYGLPQVIEPIKTERAALVVEGYTDVLMLYQSGIKNAVATLGTATTPGHLKILSRYADTVYVLFDPDTAGERATERIIKAEEVVVTAARLRLDLRLLRLDADPADWLLEHSKEQFEELLSGAVPVLEYSIGRIAERSRGTDAVSRSRAVPEMRELVEKIEDPVLYNEAVRLATEALGVGPDVFRESARRQRDVQRPGVSAVSQTLATEPRFQAGQEVLALILASPDLTSKPLKEGVMLPALTEPLALAPEDFGSEEQSRLFGLLRERPGDGIDNIVADEDFRPLLDEVGLLYSAGEKLYPSPTSVQAAWIRLRILSREHDKHETTDYDKKSRIQSEIQVLRGALSTVGGES